jgi:hypothetical protein
MLLVAKNVFSKYYALVLKMHKDVNNIMEVAHSLKLLCNLEVILGLSCIMPMFEGLNELIKISQS